MLLLSVVTIIVLVHIPISIIVGFCYFYFILFAHNLESETVLYVISI